MSQDEIIAMAKEAGFRIGQMDTLEGSRTLVKHSGFDCLAELTRFAELLPTHNAAPAPTGFSKFELVHMASQAGMIPVSYNKTSFDTEQSAYTPDLERFAALVAAKEREACAQVAMEFRRGAGNPVCGEVAAAIRARRVTRNAPMMWT